MRGWLRIQRPSARFSEGARLARRSPMPALARALAFEEMFWTNAWFAMLPFAVMAAIVWWIARDIDRETRGATRI